VDAVPGPAGRDAGRAAGAGRGLPPERVRAVLDQLAAGCNPMQAARAAGVSKSFAYSLHHKMGGVYRPPEVTCSDRYLDREERYELARLREAGLPMRQIAVRTGRSASTISRELARNADPRTGAYQPERAHRLAWDRQRRPKPSKLSRDPALRGQVQQMLDQRYSPEQASGRLKMLHPGDPAMRVSHETIYQSIYVYPRGGLRHELKACLRTGREIRHRRGRRQVRGRIIDAVPIGARPGRIQRTIYQVLTQTPRYWADEQLAVLRVHRRRLLAGSRVRHGLRRDPHGGVEPGLPGLLVG